MVSGANVTQQVQRAQQEKQQNMIRNMSMGQGGGMMRQGPNGMPNDLARKAMQNSSGRPMYVPDNFRGKHYLTSHTDPRSKCE